MISGVSDVVLNAICQSLDDKTIAGDIRAAASVKAKTNFDIAWIPIRGYRDKEENFRHPYDGVSSY